MRISDWSSDVCSSDLVVNLLGRHGRVPERPGGWQKTGDHRRDGGDGGKDEIELGELAAAALHPGRQQDRRIGDRESQHELHPESEARSEEHTSELQSLMRISYAVFCLKKKHKYKYTNNVEQNERTNTA